MQSSPKTVDPLMVLPLRINAFGVLFLMAGLIILRSQLAQLRLRDQLAPPLPAKPAQPLTLGIPAQQTSGGKA
jgi:heme exporter protein C